MALREEFETQGVWLFRYRSTLPIPILAIGFLLYLRTELYPETFVLNGTGYEVYYTYLCLAVALLGLFVRIYTVGHTPANTSGRNVEGQLADTLNTSGIYSTVRHPLYLGNFFMWLGPAMLTGNFWFLISFCLFYWVYYERIMFTEEEFLRRKFGEVYVNWSMKTPPFFPSFAHFVKPSLPFSWKKVLKKEKNGVAATFLIFSFFDVCGELIKGEQNFDYVMMYMAIASVIVYLILKVIKRNTNMLDEEGR